MRSSGLAMLMSGMGLVLAATHAVAMQAGATQAGATQAGAPTRSAPPAAGAPPPGPGLTLINDRCGFCHSTAQVFSQRKTADAWAATVQSMADRGAEVSPEEQKTIADYLARNYGAPATVPGATAVPPPAGKAS